METENTDKERRKITGHLTGRSQGIEKLTKKMSGRTKIDRTVFFTFGCRRVVRKKLERRAGNEQKDYLEARKQGRLQLKGGEKLAERST